MRRSLFAGVLLLPALAAAQGPVQAGVYALSADPFVRQAERDLQALRRYAEGLRRIDADLSASPTLFEPPAGETYGPEEKRALLSAWGAFFSYLVSIEGIRQRYWYFMRVPANDKRHAWGFLLTHTALTTQLAHGLKLASRTAGKPQLEVLLDEPNAEFGVPPRAFAQMKSKVIHVATSSKLVAGDAYRALMLKPLASAPGSAQGLVAWGLEEMRLNSIVARGHLGKRGAQLFSQNAADILKDNTATAFYPLQKRFAEWAGDTRVWRMGKPLIQRAQVEALVARAEPGDVVVARQNWYLSNIGLPGFWPHAELYLGRPDDLTRYFSDDAEVKAFLAQQPGPPADVPALFASRFPDKWKRYLEGEDTLGHRPARIIESISEGVSFTSVEHGLMVDYLGVMRPRLSKLEKLTALLRAFGYQGRPYDFNFDFFSDASLVCTELVYKSYAPEGGQRGLKIPLVKVAGRMTLPANELVRLFDEELDRDDRQLDFVAFLDGREGEGVAVESDIEAFRQSYRRVKWDVAQK